MKLLNESLDGNFQIFNHFFDILFVEKVNLTGTDRSNFFECLNFCQNVPFFVEISHFLSKSAIFCQNQPFIVKNSHFFEMFSRKFFCHVTYLEPISWSITTIASEDEDNLWFLSLDNFQNFGCEFIVLCSSICKHINIRIIFFRFQFKPSGQKRPSLPSSRKMSILPLGQKDLFCPGPNIPIKNTLFDLA